MKIDLTGKTALVCGSTQGIGKESAIQLAKSGARVILCLLYTSDAADE